MADKEGLSQAESLVKLLLIYVITEGHQAAGFNFKGASVKKMLLSVDGIARDVVAQLNELAVNNPAE